MAIESRCRTPLWTIGVALAALLLFPEDAAARGGSRGLSWGYRPPAGNPFANLWRTASPWGAMMGAGIPRRNIGPANLNMQSGPRVYGNAAFHSGSSRSYGSFNSGGGSRGTTRGIFPGSASQSARSSRQPRSMGASQSVGASAGYSYMPGDYFTDDHESPPYHNDYNSYWLHGYWGGGDSGWEQWDAFLGALTFPRWALPALFFPTGYGDYKNPFAETGKPSPPPLDYENPIELPADGDDDDATTAAGDPQDPNVDRLRRELVKSPEVTAGLKAFDAAREAFRSGDFAAALKHADEALQSMPRDPAIHQFRGLVLFAQGDYRQAAATIYATLSVSPGWDWATLSGMYANPDDYTQQLRKLETFRKENRDSADASFLLAYHYATCRHSEIAVRHLRNVGRLLPDDRLAPHLETLLAASVEKSPSDSSPGKPEDAPAESTAKLEGSDGPQIELSSVVGRWRSQRAAEEEIDLTISDDGKFVWTASRHGRNRRFRGDCVISKNHLVLSSREGMMIGLVTLRANQSFNFRLLENPPEAPGLDFNKVQ